MKNKIFLLTTILGFSFYNAHSQTCCSKPGATESFAMLGKESNFQASHLSPKPFVFNSENMQEITLKPSDGLASKAFEFKSKTPSKKYLFVIHEWWGLNDHIKKEAEKYYSNLPGVNVIALDLYDGKIATDAETAGKYMGAADEKRIRNILAAAMDYVGKDAQIATVGWCFGGGWSLQMALAGSNQTKACVIYYGMPENDIEKLKTLNSDVLGIFASKDQWINPGVYNAFKANMVKAGKKVEIKEYEADHAFANPSNPKFDEKNAKDAFERSVKYIIERLR